MSLYNDIRKAKAAAERELKETLEADLRQRLKEAMKIEDPAERVEALTKLENELDLSTRKNQKYKDQGFR